MHAPEPSTADGRAFFDLKVKNRRGAVVPVVHVVPVGHGGGSGDDVSGKQTENISEKELNKNETYYL